ncbi:MAG: hypothetical protein Q7J65_06555 [Candidatus Marinimicrobia bacterium]|nr:hypothetical protein [Candidatus Neomarinimicrobiota bacterium]
MRNSKWYVPSGEVEALIRKISDLEVGYPVIEMERLIEIGEPALKTLENIIRENKNVLARLYAYGCQPR